MNIGITGLVATKKRPLVVTDISNDPRYQIDIDLKTVLPVYCFPILKHKYIIFKLYL
jgi:hypothetical protein